MNSQISIAIRTAWPPLSHPLSDQPETKTIPNDEGCKQNLIKQGLLIACTASCRTTGEKSVAHDIDWTSSWHLRYVSLGSPKETVASSKPVQTTESDQTCSPPPSLTRAATIQIQLTANGDRSWRASYVSTFASNTDKKVEHPW